MEYFRSSQSARIASWILRERVRSWVRKRFLASCWVSVEPPSSRARRSRRAKGAGDAERIDAEMAVEAPVLDRDEGLRQIGRQVDEPTAGPPVSPRLAMSVPSSARTAMFGGRFGTASWSIGGSWLA